MAMAKLSIILAGIAGVSASVLSPIDGQDQLPLSSGHSSLSASRFKCDLPPILDPSSDGLPSADALFSSKEALAKQVARHQAIVRVPSVSYDDLGSVDEDERWKPFFELHEVIEKTFPVLHKRAKVEKINTLGLLYTIQGTDESLKPTLLMAHQDVVPVADESTWTHPPFEAVYDGKWLWGRGASDDKNSLTALLSTLETLLSNDTWIPKRTIVMAFGFDEECSGHRGAGKISETLVKRYGKDSFAIILDEGGLGINKVGNALYVLPAVTEKGHVDIWLELDVVGGHSSIPFPHTGIGIISEIVTTLESHPYKAELVEGSPVHNHLMCQARYSPDAIPALTKMLEENDLDGVAHFLVRASLPTQYMIQTSQAVDFIAGGQKMNAMPEKTILGVNYRVAHQNSVVEVQHNVVKYVRSAVAKYGLKLKAFEGDVEYQKYVVSLGSEEEQPESGGVDYKGTLTLEAKAVSHASPISPITGPAWDVFSGTIQHTFAFDGGIVVPAGQIMTGNTDTRHYLELSNYVYRFTPDRNILEENMHTIDERVNMEGHMEMVKFYYEFVRNIDAAKF